jgi:nucleotide-binding universal stress UspA family protein
MQPQILVGFDFGSASQKALDWAADLQRTVHGVPFHVVYVVNALPTVSSPETASISMLSPLDIANIRSALTAAVRKVSDSATCELIISGSAGAAIVESARQTGADLIVLGTHGRGALSRFFVGSVAEYVLRHATAPVLTIRESPAAAGPSVHAA